MDNAGSPPITRTTAGHGWLWFRDGYRLFMQSPLNWVVMCVLLMLGIIVLSMIPVASLLVQVVMPGFSAGLMLAAHALQRGDPINIGYLWEGFRRNKNELLSLGVISFIANTIIMMIAAIMISLFLGVSFITTISNLEAGTLPTEEMLGGLLLLLLILATLTMPLVMALWFAPSLVILNNLKAWDAFKTSFNACNRNLTPFLVYGLVGMVLIIIAAIPFGLGFIVLIPVFFCSIYCTWRDVFGETKIT
jgi:Predicted integral membrane protein (DUF2189)